MFEPHSSPAAVDVRPRNHDRPAGRNNQVAPTSFATADPLPDDALHSAGPPRYPRPSRLATPLQVSPAPAAKGAERLGLHTIGDLLEHLPRDRQAARTIGELAIDETATVVAEVRSITSRSVRRRGMKPLVEAVVADATGTMKATFFNQPWLERKYRPGTRLLLQGKYQGRNRFRVSFHAPTGEAVGAAADERSHASLARAFRLEPEPLSDPLFGKLGNAGCAFVPLLLASALERAKPGERILAAAYGDGALACALSAHRSRREARAAPRRRVEPRAAAAA